MNKLYNQLFIFLLLSLQFISAMEVDNFIEENKNNPKKLEELLMDMGKWEKPDLDAAKKILQMKITANATDKGDVVHAENPGTTALTTAARYGKTEYVQLLLDHDANIEIKDPWDGRTALMDAALGGHHDTVSLLLSRGANVNATNCKLDTALHFAAKQAHVETVKALLAAGADVTATNRDSMAEHSPETYGKYCKTALQEAQDGALYWPGDRYDQTIQLLEQYQQLHNNKLSRAFLR